MAVEWVIATYFQLFNSTVHVNVLLPRFFMSNNIKRNIVQNSDLVYFVFEVNFTMRQTSPPCTALIITGMHIKGG